MRSDESAASMFIFPFRPGLWAFLLLSAFVASLLLSPPAPASMGRPDSSACPPSNPVGYVNHYCADVFSLAASNGYRITVSVENDSQGPAGGATLKAERGNALVSYFGRGVVRPTGIRAKFGRFGTIAVRFQPSGRSREVRVSKSCRGLRPPVVSAQLGTFVGTIRFQGENGYTNVSARSAPGGIGDPLAIDQADPSCIESAPVEKRSVFLDATLPHGRLFFTAIANPRRAEASVTRAVYAPFDGYWFAASLAERGEGMLVLRSVEVRGSSGDFSFDHALANAEISPPGPFTGSATFSRHRDGPSTWVGSLAVSFPGLPTRSLAGPSFSAILRRATNIQPTHEVRTP